MTGVEFYEQEFAEFQRRMAGAGPAWVRDLRRVGLENFSNAGFPGLRDERWRFTRTRPVEELRFARAHDHDPNGLTANWITEQTFNDKGCHRLTLVNGHFSAGLSSPGDLPSRVWLGSLARGLAEVPELIEPHLGQYSTAKGNPFMALNTAFVADGVFIHIPDEAVIETTIHIVFVTTRHNTTTHPRVLVVAGSNSSATIVESYIGEACYFNNAVFEMVCGENSLINHTKLQRQSPESFHISSKFVELTNNSHMVTDNVAIGGAFTRNDVSARLNGEGIDCHVNGLYLGDESQHVDNSTFIEHVKPNSNSHELYKGILNGKARGVFTGKIYVHQDAQKTDAKQSNNCMLLSDTARINTCPQLEIFADDVKCTHGATIGQLDRAALFYLRTRGIDEVKARHMLIHAFAGEVIERINVATVRDRLEAELFWWLARSLNIGEAS